MLWLAASRIVQTLILWKSVCKWWIQCFIGWEWARNVTCNRNQLWRQRWCLPEPATQSKQNTLRTSRIHGYLRENINHHLKHTWKENISIWDILFFYLVSALYLQEQFQPMKETFIKLHISILLAVLTGVFGKLITLNEGLLVLVPGLYSLP